MLSYAEMYALIYDGKVVGYRIYALIDDVEQYFDFQTVSVSFYPYVVGEINLTRRGCSLLSDDELQGKYKCTPLTKGDMFDMLIEKVKYYKMLRDTCR